MNNQTYRNQTNALTTVQMLGAVRITSVQEAVAMLRAIQPILTQIATVLQRSGLREQQLINRSMVVRAKQETPQPEVEEVPQPVFVPEDLSTEEGYTEDEIEAKVAKLKSAKKVKKEKQEAIWKQIYH